MEIQSNSMATTSLICMMMNLAKEILPGAELTTELTETAVKVVFTYKEKKISQCTIIDNKKNRSLNIVVSDPNVKTFSMSQVFNNKIVCGYSQEQPNMIEGIYEILDRVRHYIRQYELSLR